MLAAYLRGLLKPDYPNGNRSIYRENLILQAIAREQEAEEIIQTVKNESNYSPLLGPAQANKLLKHQDKMLSLSFDNLRHKADKRSNKSINMEAIDKLIATYAALKKQGMVGAKLDTSENVN